MKSMLSPNHDSRITTHGLIKPPMPVLSLSKGTPIHADYEKLKLGFPKLGL